MAEKKINWLYILLSVVLTAVVLTVPGPLTAQGQAVLAVMFLAMALWLSEAIPLHITSFVIALSLIVLAGFTPEQVFIPFFDPIIALLLGGFALARAMQKHRLDEFIAFNFLKKTGQNPKTVVLGLIIVTAFLSMWMSNTASAAIMLPIGLIVLKKNNLHPLESNLGKAVVLGIAFAASIGGLGTLVGTPANAMAAHFLADQKIQLSFLDWMYYALPFVLIALPVCWALLISLFKPEKEKLVKIEFSKKLDFTQKKFLAVAGATILLWLTTSIHGLGSATVAILALTMLYLFELLENSDFPLLDWASLILIGGGLTLGEAIRASQVDSFIASFLQQSLAQQPVIFIYLTLILFAIFLTSFISNTACAAVLIPIAMSLAKLLGVEVKPLVLIVAMAVSLTFIVPVGTPPLTVAYSSGFIKVKDMAKSGLLLSAICALILAGIAFIYW